MSDIKTQPPKAYQQGWTEFYKLKLKVNPDVLIPRPETELLVDEVLGLTGSDPIKNSHDIESKQGPTLSPITVLDIGTGSGCIAISIAKNLKNVRVIATDISDKSLEVANQNATFHHVDNKIIFLQSDLFSFMSFDTRSNKRSLPSNDGRLDYHTRPQIDVIVANLPYIPTARLLLIDPMVTEHEPRIALDGGEDGFDLYRKLFKQIKDSGLFPKYLIAEIDEEQGEIAKQEAKRFFQKAAIEVKKDLSKKDRILYIKFA